MRRPSPAAHAPSETSLFTALTARTTLLRSIEEEGRSELRDVGDDPAGCALDCPARDIARAHTNTKAVSNRDINTAAITMLHGIPVSARRRCARARNRRRPACRTRRPMCVLMKALACAPPSASPRSAVNRRRSHHLDCADSSRGRIQSALPSQRDVLPGIPSERLDQRIASHIRPQRVAGVEVGVRALQRQEARQPSASTSPHDEVHAANSSGAQRLAPRLRSSHRRCDSRYS